MKRFEDLYLWNRGETLKLSKNFSTGEFTCRCGVCKEQTISIKLINKLQAVRDLVGPLTITSAYRCPAHQAALRGQGVQTAKGTSQHELGRAADVQAKNMPALEAALRKEFMAIGVAKTFFHVDLRTDKPREWRYA